MNAPWITAHSGCEQLPQDSLESVECALELKADVVEMDIRRARDGRMYISHNACTGAEAEQKVSLEQVFEKISGTCLRINCDVKEAFAVCGTLDMASRWNIPREQLIMTGSVSAETLAMEPTVTERAQVYLNLEEALKYFRIPDLFRGEIENQFSSLMQTGLPFVRTMLQNDRNLEYLIGLAKHLRVSGINMPHETVTESIMKRFHEEKILCSVWTVNDEQDMDRCLDLNVRNITTRNVRLAMKHRDLWIQKHVAD